VPTSDPTVTSIDVTDGALASQQLTDVADVHAAVPHVNESVRALGVASLDPKPSPATVKVATIVRALLSTPR
jgi:hypothetical protein